MVTAPESTIISPRDLISPRMFGRLAGRVMTDHGTGQETAERIMEQALAFLQACALNPGAGLAPSSEVDKGWHAFILHTADYAEFCERVAGRFIHHLPVQPGEQDNGSATIHATLTAMQTAGLPVDEALWLSAAKCDTTDCHQCHSGCNDSPDRS